VTGYCSCGALWIEIDQCVENAYRLLEASLLASSLLQHGGWLPLRAICRTYREAC
jgi:hypothetical protein